MGVERAYQSIITITMQKDYASMSGESTYRAPRPLELNEVSLNGDAEIVEEANGTYTKKGGYFRKRLLVSRANRDQKPEEINLGNTVDVVFLKIRRRLIERGQNGEILRSTNEHDNRGSVVNLYDPFTKQTIRNNAQALREQYSNLRTVQVVYALLCGPNEPELVRVNIKGSSLGSDNKDPNVKTFYDYMGSFEKGEHMFDFVTKLTPVLEKGAKSYYTVNFERGEKLDEKQLAYALQRLEEVYEKCVELDAAAAAKAEVAKDVSEVVVDPDAALDNALGGGIEYPKEDINPDDIPF
jgi:hypothetical protein